MAMLLANYKPEVFQEIPHFDETLENLLKLDIPSVLNSIGQVFAKHNVERPYGLAAVHRHFDMDLDEILVEAKKKDGTMTASTPWKFNGNQVTGPVDLEYWNSLELSAGGKFIHPQTWFFGDKGTLEPYEFHIENDSENDLPKLPAGFIKDLYSKLKELGLEKVFGLGLTSGQNSWETTDETKRTSIVRFDNPPKDLLKQLTMVLWTFNNQGQYNGGDACRHCHACRHSW